MKKLLSIFVIAAIFNGCATSSKDIASNYTSPVQYNGYNCQQLAQETARLQAQITQIGGRLDQASRNDKAIMGVGLIVFWPALFALGGTKEQEAQYATLKGQYDAVQQEAIQKNCVSYRRG